MSTINRREAIKRLAMLTGGALSLSTVSAIMSGCSTSGTGSFSPETLSSEQNELVTVISELIIPETDTPGAKAAGVNRFIDHMLTEWNSEEEKDHFLSSLDRVNEVSSSKFQKDFLELNEADQVKVLEQLEKEAMQKPSEVPDNENNRPFFSMMKEYTIVGYYTSEIGASQELKSNIVPGYYDACMPYDEIGRAWS